MLHYTLVVTERARQLTLARNIDFIIDRTLRLEASKAMLAKMAKEQISAKLTLGWMRRGILSTLSHSIVNMVMLLL